MRTRQYRLTVGALIVASCGLMTYCHRPTAKQALTGAEYAAEEQLCVKNAKTRAESDACACKVREKYHSGTESEVCDGGKDGE